MKNEKSLGLGWRMVAAALVCCLLQPVGVMAADITPGYTFASGEANVTHTKLNNSAAGTINPTFYSGKASAGTDPSTAFEVLLRDTTLDTFKRSTLSAAVFEHSALMNARVAKTSPVLFDSLLISDSAAGNAYKQMSWTNWMFAGAGAGVVSNDTRFPALRDGVASSVTLSNMIASAYVHGSPTNGDAFLVLAENYNGAIRKLTLKNMVTQSFPGTNWASQDMMLTYDGTRMRSMRGTNFIDGVIVTNTVPLTNDSLVVLQGSTLKKLFLNELRAFVNPRNIAFAANTNSADMTPNGAWLDVPGLTVTILPRSGSSMVLVTATLSVDVDTAPAHFKFVRGLGDVGVGIASSLRTKAGTSIDNASTTSVVMQWLDSCGPTNTTYKVQCFQATGGANHIYLGRSSADTDNVSNPRAVATLMAEEIYQ
jgi:hypothetical protein